MKTPIYHRLPELNSGGGLLFKRRERGFTMVELLVVVTIMAILTAVAAPNLMQLLTSMRIKNASFDVYAGIAAARSEAITRNTTITITPVSGTTNWAAGWNVTVAGVPVKTQNAFAGVTMTGPATLVYNSSGRLATAATCPAGTPTTVCISLTATNAPAVVGRCVTIDLSGRPVTAKGVCP
jgi:type IV fimbrial biogenesis protein FimT